MDTAEAPREKMDTRRRWLSAAACVCSVASVAFCVLLGITAADLRGRLAQLEGSRGPPGAQLGSVVEQKLRELLSQVKNARSRPHARALPRVGPTDTFTVTFQRPLDQLGRIRTARQASPDCSCPPGETRLGPAAPRGGSGPCARAVRTLLGR